MAYRAIGKSKGTHKWRQKSEFRERFSLATGPGSDLASDLALEVTPLPLPARGLALSPHCAQINTRSYAPALKLSRVSLPAVGVGEPEEPAEPVASVRWSEIASDRIDILAEVRREIAETSLIEQLISKDLDRCAI